MKITKHEMLLSAAEPIAHSMGTIGNKSLLMRKKVRSSDGFVSVPYITGDTLRKTCGRTRFYIRFLFTRRMHSLWTAH